MRTKLASSFSQSIPLRWGVCLILLISLFFCFFSGFKYFTSPCIKKNYHSPKTFIVIGGVSDPLNCELYDVVKSIFPSSNIYFFHWFQTSNISETIKELGPEERFFIIAHSWGGKTALEIAQKNASKVICLITLDPVSFIEPSYRYDHKWINIVPQYSKITFANLAAYFGHRWQNCQHAINITLPGEHDSLFAMFLARDKNGSSLEDMILRISP